MSTRRTILVTGAAGFVGFHLVRRLAERGDRVVGIDNINDYYDPELKHDRLAELARFEGFTFHKLDLVDGRALDDVVEHEKPSAVVHLAAQAGVRYSLKNPSAYVSSNLVGFVNILEACRHNQVGHLVFASSSSVYGANTHMPFSVHDNVDHPVSLYAATKKSNELLAHSYSHLYRLPCTGLRFFTVYGPWGRPDMAYFSFTRAILEGRTIDVYNNGEMQRDFTYIDDIVEGIVRVTDHPAQPNPAWSGDHPDPGTSAAPYRIYNIGNHVPVKLTDFIRILEGELGRKANINLLPMQPGDVVATFADIEDLERDVGFSPHTSLQQGLGAFVAWYRQYYGIENEESGTEN